MNKIYLEKLPRHKNGKYSDSIKWKECIGYNLEGYYENIDFKVEIVDYEPKKQLLSVKYNNNIFKIRTGEFVRCKLGRILGKRTGEFKIEIGTRFQNSNRDITITDRKIIEDEKGVKRKWYKYHCNKCGFDCSEHYSIRDEKYKEEIWIEESYLLGKRKGGCQCCCGQSKIVVENINSIVTTDPWMIPYFQGGYDEAKLYTHNSGQKIYPICPDCGQVRGDSLEICSIYKNNSIGCSCSDNVSFPEKVMFSVLSQLDLDFQIQLTKTIFKWIGDYRYDFYFKLNKEQFIIETHGKQHYEEPNKGSYYCKSLKKQQQIDKNKKELALVNGIKEENYIIIDCRKSEIEWIRDNEDGILNSGLAELFDLSKVDWLKAEEFTLGNRLKEVCELKRNNPELSKTELCKITKIKKRTMDNYLKLGDKLGLCTYDAMQEYWDNRNLLSIEVFKDGVSYGKFSTVKELTDNSKELLGVTLFKPAIYSIHTGKLNTYKGFNFIFEDSLKQTS